MEREGKQRSESAFGKACGYLNYNPRARWLAYLAAAGSALVVVGLLGLLWLFVDYMVWRGRVPTFGELSVSQERAALQRWDRASAEARDNWLERAGFTASERAQLVPVRSADLTRPQRERVWEELVEDILMARLGQAAVLEVFEEGPASPSGWDRREQRDHGVLSLVVRSQLQWMPSVVPWLASWNPWMWNRGAAGVTLFPPYLFGLALGTVILGLLGTVLIIVNREMAGRAATEASSRLRRAVYHQTFRLGTLAIRALGPTEAVTILTRHCEALHDALYTLLTTAAREPIVLTLLILFAFWIDPILSLAFLLFGVILYVVGVQMLAYFRKQGRAATNIAAERLTIIRESLMLMRLVKCYLMETFNQARIERQLVRYGQVQRLRHRAEAIALPLLVLLAGACLLVLTYVGALLVLYGELPVAGAATLAATFLCLYRPLDRYLDSSKLLKRGREAAEAIFVFLERKGDVGQVVGAEFLPPMSKVLEFDGVSLREGSGGRLLLDDVSLTIPAGQKIGLVGADELEKQALVYLIPRLLDPTAGEVRIDQHNLRWVTLDSLRAQIGIVMMHNLVFHDSVRNNIGCGDTVYTLPQIIEAAKIAHAHHFIQRLPEGYETPVGELGHSLSLSEQYRIALARAILRDPALLIIEEPDTELDEETKGLLDDTLARVLPGRTAIFLPHRISTLRACNKIYLLNKGRVAAAGTHKELLGGHKLYRHLHYLEFNEMDER